MFSNALLYRVYGTKLLLYCLTSAPFSVEYHCSWQVRYNLMLSCWKNSNCSECMLAICNSCHESCLEAGGKRRRKYKKENKGQCAHNVHDLEPETNQWWTSADRSGTDLVQNYPKGCVACMKLFLLVSSR